MRCDEVRDSLVAYLDGEISVEERDRIESHLAGCSPCRKERMALDTTGDLLKLIGQREKSDLDIAGRVLAVAAEGDPWCRHIRRELVAYVDGALEEGEAIPVEEHVGECEDCAAEAEGLRRTYRALSVWEAPEFEVDLAARIAVGRPRRRGWIVRLVPAAAAACLLVAAGVLALRSREKPVTEEPPIDAVILQTDPELIELAENLDWLESVTEEELALLNGGG